MSSAPNNQRTPVMASTWTPGSWRSKPAAQMPEYPDPEALARISAPVLLLLGRQTRLGTFFTDSAASCTAPLGLAAVARRTAWSTGARSRRADAAARAADNRRAGGTQPFGDRDHHCFAAAGPG